MNQILSLYDALPERKKLFLILWSALILRIVASIFSAGYAMHDDHFLVVETPSSWVYGYDSGSWFPETQQRDLKQGKIEKIQPQGHSLFYPGVQYAFFSTLKFMGVENPKTMIFINRLFHGLLGVLVVYLTYVLAAIMSDKKRALSIAWIAALGWALPFLSVRNLVEMVAIPFLLSAVILSLKGMRENALKLGLLAGVLMAVAVSIRYQTVVFFGVFGLILLFQKQWKLAFSILFGAVVSFAVFQGVPDWLIWGSPFAEMLQYFGYNMSDARFEYAEALGGRTYGINYFPVLAFLTIPFLGAFWLFGFFLQWKKFHLLFWPCLAFLAVHMSYVNTQERFVFPILHVVLILGYLGWHEFKNSSRFWLKNQGFWSGISKFSWGLNFILLFFLSTYYGKRARVESAYKLYKNEHVDLVIHENTVDGYIPLLPMFYAKKWDMQVYPVRNAEQYSSIANNPNEFTAWIYFQGDENLEERVNQAADYFPDMRYVETFEASFLDKVVKKINPVNRNESIVVYEVKSEGLSGSPFIKFEF